MELVIGIQQLVISEDPEKQSLEAWPSYVWSSVCPPKKVLALWTSQFWGTGVQGRESCLGFMNQAMGCVEKSRNGPDHRD